MEKTKSKFQCTKCNVSNLQSIYILSGETKGKYINLSKELNLFFCKNCNTIFETKKQIFVPNIINIADTFVRNTIIKELYELLTLNINMFDDNNLLSLQQDNLSIRFKNISPNLRNFLLQLRRLQDKSIEILDRYNYYCKDLGFQIIYNKLKNKFYIKLEK